MQRLKGKTAVVVGAGSIGPGWGNGKATAVTFAREGAQVFCVDRNGAAAEETVKIIASEGGQAMAFTADVSRAADVEAMVAACLKAYGRIDVLDNNVGIAEMGSVVDVSEADWDRVFAVNVRGVFLVTKHAAPLLRQSDDAHIINTNSIVGARPGAHAWPISQAIAATIAVARVPGADPAFARDARRRARRLRHRRDLLGRARDQRSAQLLPADPPGHAADPGRPDWFRQVAEPAP